MTNEVAEAGDISAGLAAPQWTADVGFQALVELLPDAVYVIQNGYHVFANARGLAILGARTLADLQTRPAIDFMHESCREVARFRLRKMVDDRQPLAYVEERIVRLDSAVVDIESAGTPITVGGKPAALVVVRDITARKQADAALRAAQDRFQSAFRHAPTGMAIVDDQGIVLEANRALARLLGGTVAELVGSSAWEAVDERDRPGVQLAFQRLVEGVDYVQRGEFRARARGGAQAGEVAAWVHASASPLAFDATFVVHLIDVTVQKAAERRLAREATHDPLTGLPNRVLVMRRLESALRRLGDRSEGVDGVDGVAVLFVDLDGFKQVNDGHGHGVGDEVLKQVAERLHRVVRQTDTVGRLGGDEFGIVVAGRRFDVRADQLARRIGGALEEPFRVPAGWTRLSASVGIATTRDGATTPEELIRQADFAMYRTRTDRGSD
jgi:diguanylate cyclase (GGDEF)-like protein/PAS domain S-box-containing protein